MKYVLLLILTLTSTSSFSQQNEKNFVKADSSTIKILGNIVYKAHQELVRAKDSSLSTRFYYTKVDLTNILFRTSKSEILSESFDELTELSKLMKENPKTRIKIIGHTDKIGNRKSNLKLSIRRARAIRIYLIKKGVKSNKIVAQGLGDQFTICESPCKKNQRVEFTITHGKPFSELVD